MKDKELNQALIEFRRAFQQLNEAIERTEHDEVIAGTHYPFEASFDEIPIPEWVAKSIEKLG